MAPVPGNPTARPFVRVRITGGLGNQMFAAAAGMALSQRLGASLEFALYKYARLKQRHYELGVFGLDARLVQKSKWAYARLAAPALALGLGGQGPATVWQEPGFHYDDSFERLTGNVYLKGFFQSPRYFASAAGEVRRAFDLKPHLSDAGRGLAAAAAGDDSVAVHIRRGDYVTNPDNHPIFPALDAGYYGNALSLLSRLPARPRLFVVSDDADAARALLADWPGATFVTGTTHFDDMHLISSCRHRVIANSSFSWWGAWLDSRPGGVTIAPQGWFTREYMMRNHTLDLYPAGWVTM